MNDPFELTIKDHAAMRNDDEIGLWPRERLDRETLAALDPDHVGLIAPHLRTYPTKSDSPAAYHLMLEEEADLAMQKLSVRSADTHMDTQEMTDLYPSDAVGGLVRAIALVLGAFLFAVALYGLTHG